MTKIILSLLFLCPVSALQAKEFSVTRRGQIQWKLSQSARNEFQTFLARNAESLESNAPYLAMIEGETSLVNAVTKHFLSTGETYVNREGSCVFLKRIHTTTKNPVAKEKLKSLTKNFTVCIARDLAAAEQGPWAQQMIQFVWKEAWLPLGAQNISLMKYVTSRMGIELESDELDIQLLNDFDAYGYGYSPLDFQVVQASPLLAEILNLTRDFSVNDPSPAFRFGKEVQELAQKYPASVGSFFITKPTIYISGAWSPADLPELLSHEFGHVVHGLHREYLRHSKGLVTLNIDRVQEEAAAEAFAWQSLCELYEEYPEMMNVHIKKLQMMAKFKPDDYHLVGASAFAKDFHYQCRGPQRFLEFVKAKSLKDFKTSPAALTEGSKKPDEVIRFHW